MSYLVLDDGRIYGEKRRKFLTPKVNRKRGYCYVDICLHGVAKTYLVHRLVAEAYLPNPKPTVNHKNGDKTDNRVANLEWATYSENHLHSFRELGRMGGYTGQTTKYRKDNGKKENPGKRNQI